MIWARLEQLACGAAAHRRRTRVVGRKGERKVQYLA